MRAEQWMGLNSRAEDIVKGERILLYTDTIVRVYPDRAREDLFEPHYGSNVKMEKYRDYEGAFGGRYEMYRYHFPDGKVMYEDVQDEPWSSGPMTFLALKDDATDEWIKESLWTDEEIQSYL